MTNLVNYNSDINNLMFSQKHHYRHYWPYNWDMLPPTLRLALWWLRRWRLSINIGDLDGMIFNNATSFAGITRAIWIMIVYLRALLISLVGFISLVKMTDKKTIKVIKNIPFQPTKTITATSGHDFSHWRQENKWWYWFWAP